ncbi:MAG: hypothetical protein QM777_09820 [Pseudorhodoferax sp.]
MKHPILSIGIALTQVFAVSAFAQGEAGVSKAPPSAAKVSAEEAAAARAHRKAEGAEAVKQQPVGEAGQSKAAPSAQRASAEDRAAASAQRKAEGAEAIKQQPVGEVGQSKAPPASK